MSQPLSPLPDLMIEPLVRAALIEDLGRAGDVTAALLHPGERLAVVAAARKPGIAAGLQPARLAFDLIGGLSVRVHVVDGERVEPGQALMSIEGSARAILTAERTALNFLTHLSGVATLTRAFVDAVAGTGAHIAATRKTLPGLRAVQKAAVLAGGAWPHRYGLDDAILIKDNHVAAAGGVAEALRRARALAGHLTPIEVEVDRLSQLDEALPFQPTAVLLDNFSLPDLAEAVRRAKGRTLLEASGGVTLESVRDIAGAGVDVISVGALTHSAPALDIGLDAR